MKVAALRLEELNVKDGHDLAFDESAMAAGAKLEACAWERARDKKIDVGRAQARNGSASQGSTNNRSLGSAR
jgi:hypothetical protein